MRTENKDLRQQVAQLTNLIEEQGKTQARLEEQASLTERVV